MNHEPPKATNAQGLSGRRRRERLRAGSHVKIAALRPQVKKRVVAEGLRPPRPRERARAATSSPDLGPWTWFELPLPHVSRRVRSGLLMSLQVVVDRRRPSPLRLRVRRARVALERRAPTTRHGASSGPLEAGGTRTWESLA
jgi:hypothetical protein